MSKEFMNYNKEFKHLERTDSMESLQMQEASKKCNIWPWKVDQWPQDAVQYAVYEAENFIEWQKFRVSLKGQSTRMKILRLALYKAQALVIYHRQEYLDVELCRVDNYLGALVRGGQLNSDYEVVR